MNRLESACGACSGDVLREWVLSQRSEEGLVASSVPCFPMFGLTVVCLRMCSLVLRVLRLECLLIRLVLVGLNIGGCIWAGYQG